MKRMFISRFLPALILIASTILSFTACQKEDDAIVRSTPQLFQKVVTLTDVSGKNSVTLKLSSTDAGYLDFCERSMTLAPVFKIQEGSGEGAVENPEGTEIKSPYAVEILEVSRQLEPGAVAFSLKIEAPSTTDRSSGYYSGSWQFTSYGPPHYFYVKKTSYGGTVQARFFRQSGSNWICISECWGCYGITLYNYNAWASCSNSGYSSAQRMITQGTGGYSYYVYFY